MLQEQYDYFKANRSNLVEKYYGRYIVIKGNQVIADYGDRYQAYKEMTDKYKLGTFMIHKCVPAEEEEVMYFASNNVSFDRVVAK
jgi:hypothetical protein